MAKAIGKWTRIPFGPNTNNGGSSSAVNHHPVAGTSSGAPGKGSMHVIGPADCKQFGLENFGNTCYANSVLQALYFCSPFRDLVIQYPDSAAPVYPVSPPASPSPSPTASAAAPQPTLGRRPPTGSNTQRKFSTSSLPNGNTDGPPTLFSALRSLFLYISKNPADKGTVAPRAFIDKLKELNELFRSTMHQDAHEFLNYLLNKIVEEMEDDRQTGAVANGNGHVEDLSTSITTLSSISPRTHHSHSGAQTLVHRLFEGVLTSETRCLTCETVSSRSESFLDLSIDIEQNSSLTACLRQFSASEMLCQRNKFFCDSCCGLQEAEKRMKIKILPPILALHLKRFKYQESLGKHIKLSYRVAFPFELRLFNTVDDAEPSADRLYELFAVVVHIGNGPHHGHYITIVKSRAKWYVFDDESVDVIKESDIPKYFGENSAGAAYVLYYQAADLDFRSLGIRTGEEEEPAVPPGLGGGGGSGVSIKVTADEPAPGSPVDKVPPVPSLSLQIPPSTPSAAGEISPSTSVSTGSGRGKDREALLHTVRHSPSAKMGSPADEGGRSPVKSRHDEGGTVEDPGPGVSSGTLGKSVIANGKERERVRVPEKKTSTWFRRKSARVGGDDSRPGTAGSSAGPSMPMSPSAWFKTAGRHQHHHHHSTSGASQKMALDHGFPRTDSASPTPPELLSTTSSVGSHSHSSRVPDVPPLPRLTDLPAPPPLSTATSVPSSPVSTRNYIPKRSSSTAKRRPLPELPPPTPGPMRARPSTAGASSSSSSRGAAESPPPLPTLSPNRLHEMARERKEKESDSYKRRPQSAHANADLATSPRIISPTVSSGSHSGSATWKRASRKLSITGSMLTFGRKKEKGSEKEKDVSPPPPSAFQAPGW
ncbi:cysteine proteinase [Neolentinus lepideus HHB14362 ss-1]|uniref:Ubiquitin carboxyl-terminal hydrolase n=1 Tax=Neolentinus lepideus HHB14362 ss-1 TaxID=1314782 RepID=A0A165QNJ8_9AGAM|nr:cysteine proteinase [Neolentinus lepideus HHB14362 ss-1]